VFHQVNWFALQTVNCVLRTRELKNYVFRESQTFGLRYGYIYNCRNERQRHSIHFTCNAVLRSRFLIFQNKARCKQDKANAAFPTGVYIDVHEQGKT